VNGLTGDNEHQTKKKAMRSSNDINKLGQRKLRYTSDNVCDDIGNSRKTVHHEGRGDVGSP